MLPPSAPPGRFESGRTKSTGAPGPREGTLVFISHDVHFIRSLATKVLHITEGKVTAYAGDYDYYLQKTGAEENARAAVIAA